MADRWWAAPIQTNKRVPLNGKYCAAKCDRIVTEKVRGFIDAFCIFGRMRQNQSVQIKPRI
jgi:hypothetical protein